MIKSDAIDKKKKEARIIFKKIRSELSGEEREPLDSTLFSNVISCKCFADADTVLCYYPVKGEPNILPIAEYALKMKKTVAFPISHVQSKKLSFHSVKSLSELKKGAYGIPEPSPESSSPTDLKRAICIVPALAFDKTGKRLGYGGGYYDRFLSEFEGKSIGLAYSIFYVDKLPADEYDATINLIITEKGEVFLNE